MNAYMTRSFDRDAKRDGISDEDCQEAIRRAEKGLIDANLGRGLIKQRILGAIKARREGREQLSSTDGEGSQCFCTFFPKVKRPTLVKKSWRIITKPRKCLRSSPKRSFSPFATKKDGEKYRYD
jgi:hypothetical protein